MSIKIIDFEFRFCTLCGYRVTLREHFYLIKDKQCPKCNHGTAGEFRLLTCNLAKYQKPEAKACP